VGELLRSCCVAPGIRAENGLALEAALRIIASEMPERPKSALRHRQPQKNFFRRCDNDLVSFSVTIGDAAR
jgi:hypothetical protein